MSIAIRPRRQEEGTNVDLLESQDQLSLEREAEDRKELEHLRWEFSWRTRLSRWLMGCVQLVIRAANRVMLPEPPRPERYKYE